MKNVLLFVISVFIIGCSGSNKSDQETEKNKQPTMVKIYSNAMDIVMADTLLAGWNHLLYENKSSMTHFLLFNKVPDHIGVKVYADELTKPFQEVMDAIAANQEPPNNFPAWLGDMVNMGGVGLTSAGQTSESYINLIPGNYIVECYIKSNGIFHSSVGMLKQIKVLGNSKQSEPSSQVTINIGADGLSIEGKLPQQGGTINFKVSYGESKLYENFTRPDVHLVKVTEGANLNALESYMDWTTEKGMDATSPVVFIGGVQEMPEGSIAYFSQHLSSGKYILIGEVPDPKGNGFYIEFEITD